MDKTKKFKKYKLWYEISLFLGVIVLLDNTIYFWYQVNVVPTIFLYTVGKLGSLSLLNFVIYVWSRSWIVWFALAFVLNRKKKSFKEIELGESKT